MNNSFKANVKAPKLEGSSKKHQLVNPLLFRLDTIPSQSEVEPSDDDAEDIMRCSLLCVVIHLHRRLRKPLIFRKDKQQTIPIIQPTFCSCKTQASARKLKKTLPKALRTQALTALTCYFGLVGLVQCAW